MSHADDNYIFFVHHPRGFANEYNVYVCEPEQVEALKQIIPDAEQIDRKKAIRIGWHKVQGGGKEAGRGTGFYTAGYPATSITEAIDVASRYTTQLIEQGHH